VTNGTDQNAKWRPIDKWLAIVGQWQFNPQGGATYFGSEPVTWAHGICVCRDRFSEGEVRVTVKPKDVLDGRILLGYRSLAEDYFVGGLGGYGRAYTLSHYGPVVGWHLLFGAGRAEDLIAGTAYLVCIQVSGQRIVLEINDIRVFEYVLPVPVPFGQLGLFAWGQKGSVEFTDAQVKEKGGRGDAFVVMQLSGFEELYSDVIRPVTESFKLKPYRADEKFGPGNILEDIVRGIETAQVVIAEVTPTNENVFYEVGYAHALKKPTILLAEEGKKLPFDLSGYRCIFYENSIGGKQRIIKALDQHLKAILRE
jgi:hypothetical protein